MNVQSAIHSHIDITDTLARLYLFLAQSMDRCVSEAARINYPEAELQSHLASTKAAVLDMLAVTRWSRQRLSRSVIACARLSWPA